MSAPGRRLRAQPRSSSAPLRRQGEVLPGDDQIRIRDHAAVQVVEPRPRRPGTEVHASEAPERIATGHDHERRGGAGCAARRPAPGTSPRCWVPARRAARAAGGRPAPMSRRPRARCSGGWARARRRAHPVPPEASRSTARAAQRGPPRRRRRRRGRPRETGASSGSRPGDRRRPPPARGPRRSRLRATRGGASGRDASGGGPPTARARDAPGARVAGDRVAGREPRAAGRGAARRGGTRLAGSAGARAIVTSGGSRCGGDGLNPLDGATGAERPLATGAERAGRCARVRETRVRRTASASRIRSRSSTSSGPSGWSVMPRSRSSAAASPRGRASAAGSTEESPITPSVSSAHIPTSAGPSTTSHSGRLREGATPSRSARSITVTIRPRSANTAGAAGGAPGTSVTGRGSSTSRTWLAPTAHASPPTSNARTCTAGRLPPPAAHAGGRGRSGK